MKTLREIFDDHDHYALSKWSTYLEAYQAFFERYRNKEITLLEIGVSHGGSLQVWRKFFGPQAKIYGVDIFEVCKNLEVDAEIFIGSQSDRSFLRDLKTKIPKLDILIDDGGHSMRQQIITFQELFDHVKEDGIYACEDLHTSYWRKFGGGYKRAGTFIEYSKNLIDQLNARHSRQAAFRPDEFTKSSFSMHYFDSLLLIQKRPFVNEELFSGHFKPHQGFRQKRNKFKEILQSVIDRICMKFRIKDPFKR